MKRINFTLHLTLSCQFTIAALIYSGFIIGCSGAKVDSSAIKKRFVSTDATENLIPAPLEQTKTPEPPAVDPEDVVSSVVTRAFCNDKGLVWDAKKIPKCGEPMLSFSCTKAEVLSHYPLIADEKGQSLESLLAKMEDSGFKLYNCGQLDEDKVRLHFLKLDEGATEENVDDANFSYKSIDI